MTTLSYLFAAFLLVCSAMLVRRNIAKQMLLLAGSYLFYQLWGSAFLAILFASSVGNFYLGAWLRKRPEIGRLWTGIIFNILLLSFFKYLPALPATSHFFERIVMPVGMSF